MAAKPAQVLEIDPPNEIVLSGPYTDIVTTHLKLTNPSARVVAFKKLIGMAAKPAQVLEIDPPNEIVLYGPYTDIVTTHLKLTNPSARVVAFKVKTTAPKQYCVRPNSGVIPANSSTNVAIMLQPFDANSDKDRSKHKFMVQSAFVPDAQLKDKQPLDTLWKNLPGHELMDSKLRVVFEQSASDMTGSLDMNASTGPADIAKLTHHTPQRSVSCYFISYVSFNQVLVACDQYASDMIGSLDMNASTGPADIAKLTHHTPQRSVSCYFISYVFFNQVLVACDQYASDMTGSLDMNASTGPADIAKLTHHTPQRSVSCYFISYVFFNQVLVACDQYASDMTGSLDMNASMGPADIAKLTHHTPQRSVSCYFISYVFFNQVLVACDQYASDMTGSLDMNAYEW